MFLGELDPPPSGTNPEMHLINPALLGCISRTIGVYVPYDFGAFSTLFLYFRNLWPCEPMHAHQTADLLGSTGV